MLPYHGPDGTISEKSRRRLRRRIMSDHYASIASVWQGKTSRPEGRPVNRDAARVVAPKTRSGSRKRVYVVRFTLKGAPEVAFLKIGITGKAVIDRFDVDSRNYEIVTIALSEKLVKRDALLVEASLHRVFRESGQRLRPPVALMSGNTECFRYNEANVERMRELLTRSK